MAEHTNMLKLYIGRAVVKEITFEHKYKGIPCIRDLQLEMPIFVQLYIKVVSGSACYNRSLYSLPFT